MYYIYIYIYIYISSGIILTSRRMLFVARWRRSERPVCCVLQVLFSSALAVKRSQTVETYMDCRQKGETREGGRAKMAAQLVEGSSYALSSAAPRFQRSVVHVKLTDSASRTLDEYLHAKVGIRGIGSGGHHASHGPDGRRSSPSPRLQPGWSTETRAVGGRRRVGRCVGGSKQLLAVVDP